MYIYFSMWALFHEHSRITGLQGKGEGISLTPHCHFHPLHRHLDISRVITAKSSECKSPTTKLHALTNIQAFICNFACEMTMTCF